MVTGAYTMIYWVHTSTLDNHTYTSALLEKSGEVLFSTTKNEEVFFSLTHGGNVHGHFHDNSTGFEVRFSTTDGGNFIFQIEHRNVVFESDQWSSNEYSRFTNLVTVVAGNETFQGVGVNEQGFILENFSFP